MPNEQLHKPKGRFFWFVPDAIIHYCLRRNMPTQTKRTVPLVCFRCVNTLLFTPKQTKRTVPLVCGMTQFVPSPM